MDWLLESSDALEKEVFWQVATRLELDVDLRFFDTTSTYFELDEPDAPVARDERGTALPEATHGHGATKTAGFAAMARPRTTATTCRRSSSGWRSPAPGSRCGCGAGRATPPTPR